MKAISTSASKLKISRQRRTQNNASYQNKPRAVVLITELSETRAWRRLHVKTGNCRLPNVLPAAYTGYGDIAVVVMKTSIFWGMTSIDSQRTLQRTTASIFMAEE
jgi:hypothetical protein